MLARCVIAAAIACTLGAPAFAANSTSSTSTQAPNTNSSTSQTQNLPSEIRAKLQQDGFTNVKIVPGSFLVSAKDKNGDPVTMVIGPNSMMMLTEVPNSNTATTGGGVANSETSSGASSGTK